LIFLSFSNIINDTNFLLQWQNIFDMVYVFALPIFRNYVFNGSLIYFLPLLK